MDLFEEKVRRGGASKLRRYFPRLDDYQLMCPAARKEMAAPGADQEVVRAKYFVRDSFLQVAAQGAAAAAVSGASAPAASSGGGGGRDHRPHSTSGGGGGPSGGGGPAGPHCYPHFTCAIHTEDIGKLVSFIVENRDTVL